MFLYNLFFRDIPRREFLAVLSGVTSIVGIWILAGDALEFFNVLRTDTKSLFTRKHEEAAALEKDEGLLSSDAPPERQGWRRFTVENPEASKRHIREVPRDFSMSYKHFSKRWVDVLQVMWARLFKRRGTSEENPPSKH